MKHKASGIVAAASIVFLWALPCPQAVSQQGPPPSHAAEISVRLNIARQSLTSALTSFAEQSGFQLVYRTEDVSPALVAPPISGTYMPEVALTHLLADSGLEFYRINDRTIGIRAAAPR